ncbi:GDP-mannose 4,6-dehydratase [Aeoliella sp. ICT_H6.2]|uniref:GDP-mannose 4,6-dehydratase n=1 Tax=Aeoliella straminimaris TaxID=2954799 RepID=A0A9X2FFV7_9BACT|nr:GDP-mannose 4,6-dehydratase [Aeoliella straminimaris]MCO6044961.1 GDP-mannose 4,6-dehydratase [Aeoliella straminimaris]
MDQSSHEGKRALITGITGQDGSYLAELLLDKGYSVWGMVRRHSSRALTRIDHLVPSIMSESPRLELVHGDLRDSGSLLKILRRVRPDEIYNLAAQSDVKVSFDLPEYTADVTGLGPLRLLEAIRELDLPARFFQASSSEMFGKVQDQLQNELTRLHPRSPYGSAKAFAFHTTRNYREAYGLFAVNGIMFNHESPRRGESFVTRKISLAAARIHHGLQENLSLGNLEAQRDWGFAGDYMEGAWRMLQADKPNDYVLATGESHSVREVCELVFQEIGQPITWQGHGLDEVGVGPDGRKLVVVHPEFYRPSEVDTLRGDSTRARSELGWAPAVSFTELVQMMVRSDLEQAEQEANRADIASR